QLISSKCLLFKSDKETGKWQRKACGNLKIIWNLPEKQFKIIMIDDQIHTLCASHIIRPGLRLLAMSHSDHMFCYEALDEFGEKKNVEQFAIKFKNKKKAE
ncbi:unnamed protein product, partial [Lymnaea stagnalis]